MDARCKELDIPDNCAATLIEGSRYYFSGDTEKAVKCYETLWHKHSNNEALLYRYLAALLKNRQSDLALSIIEKCVNDQAIYADIKSRLSYFGALIEGEMGHEDKKSIWLKMMVQQYPLARYLVPSLHPVSPCLAIHTFISMCLLFRLHMLETKTTPNSSMGTSKPDREKILATAKMWLEEPLTTDWPLAKVACAQIYHFENDDDKGLNLLRAIRREEYSVAPALLAMLLVSCEKTRQEGLQLLLSQINENHDNIAEFDYACILIDDQNEEYDADAAIFHLIKSAEGGFSHAQDLLGKLVILHLFPDNLTNCSVLIELMSDPILAIWIQSDKVKSALSRYTLIEAIDMLKHAEQEQSTLTNFLDNLRFAVKELSCHAIDQLFLPVSERNNAVLSLSATIFQAPSPVKSNSGNENNGGQINTRTGEITENTLLVKNNVFQNTKPQRAEMKSADDRKSRTCGYPPCVIS